MNTGFLGGEIFLIPKSIKRKESPESLFWTIYISGYLLLALFLANIYVILFSYFLIEI